MATDNNRSQKAGLTVLVSGYLLSKSIFIGLDHNFATAIGAYINFATGTGKTVAAIPLESTFLKCLSTVVATNYLFHIRHGLASICVARI